MERQKDKRLSLSIVSRTDSPFREAGKLGGSLETKGPAKETRIDDNTTLTLPSLGGRPLPARNRRLPTSATTSFDSRPREENVSASAAADGLPTDRDGKPRRLPISISRGTLDRLA